MLRWRPPGRRQRPREDFADGHGIQAGAGSLAQGRGSASIARPQAATRAGLSSASTPTVRKPQSIQAKIRRGGVQLGRGFDQGFVASASEQSPHETDSQTVTVSRPVPAAMVRCPTRRQGPG
jgi:hypothetical protein